MRSTIKYLFVLIVVVLFFVPQSYGQNGWVLWDGFSTDISNWEWKAVSVYPTYEECVQEAKDRCKVFINILSEPAKAEGAKLEAIGSNAFSVTMKTGENEFYKYQCFPGTIDPRK